jgi:large subunit ribosomal protein L4
MMRLGRKTSSVSAACGLASGDSEERVAVVATAETGPLSLNVYNSQGDQTGTVELDPTELGGEINRQLLHEVVLMYLANQRAGTHSTKRRGEVAGSTKKLFRQKGTGNARVGTRRTNKRRGGGTAKGPKPRDYEYHLPRKAVRAATRMALLSKFQDEEAVVVEDLKLEEIRTKAMAEILDNLGIEGVSCLIGLGAKDIDEERTVYLSARNIRGVEVRPATQFNAYEVLRPKCLLLTRSALEEVCKNLKWKSGTEGGPAGAGSTGTQA